MFFVFFCVCVCAFLHIRALQVLLVSNFAFLLSFRKGVKRWHQVFGGVVPRLVSCLGFRV